MRRLLLLLFLLTRFAAAQPLPAKLALKQFGPAEGLPQPFIYALVQDRAGYLWLGTAEGLVRFDGTTFRTFTTREGLAEDFVTQLALAPRSGRWRCATTRVGSQLNRVPASGRPQSPKRACSPPRGCQRPTRPA
ncbi:two-component regulator propeller domain-containing protein [Hymenobacter lapidiphilus]|uniref:two-component regulator propeller domain-containing protein n=1 Tax=Hymenobacter sp. CCM 8763 TaxID=2303334 RepID=UPI00167EA601